MPGESPWTRQKREIDSYNTFYAAYSGRASEKSFHDQGYILVNTFPNIRDSQNNVEAQPDFLLYNGRILLLVEVNSGNNIESRHVSQIEEFSRLSIESAENYVKETEPVKRSSYAGDVRSIEPLISYQGLDKTYINKCRNEWEDCREKLVDLEDKCPILIQSPGEKLEIAAGNCESEPLHEWLDRGIRLPSNPKKEILLTEGMEPECLAVAICGIWGQRAANKDVEISITNIRSQFDSRAIEPGRIRKVIHFLDEIDACDIVENGSMKARFTQEHIDQVLDIEQRVSEKSVDEWLK